jgi:hypothetical protein
MPANSSVESACAMRITSLASEGKNILAKTTVQTRSYTSVIILGVIYFIFQSGKGAEQ